MTVRASGLLAPWSVRLTPVPKSFGPLMRRGPSRTLRIGFVPLTDAGPLLVAEALGFFDHLGLRVALSAEPGWATLRDRLAFGALDAAHILGPMPIALAAGLGGIQADLVVAAGLGANGNTITLSTALAEDIAPFTMPLQAEAFAQAIRARAQKSLPKITLAVVHPYSSHHYLLRHWLAEAGLDPDRDIRLTVVPPPLIAQHLADGAIDGSCAGEPWGSHAAALGSGRIALSSGDIWPDHPEKFLAFRADVLAADRESVIAITAAVIAATRWLEAPENQPEAVRILAARAFPTLAQQTIAAALEGQAAGITLAHPLRFRGASLPRRPEAAWWASAMRRWGHLPHSVPDSIALGPWADDSLWRIAAARVGEAAPPTTNTPPRLPELETLP